MAVPKTWTTNEVLTAADLNASLASTAWTAVTYTNSWVDYGSGNQVSQYRKVGDVVFVRGVMKNGTLNVGCFTLPSGFRPPATLRVVCADSGFMTVDSTGGCTAFIGSNTIFGFNFCFSVTA